MTCGDWVGWKFPPGWPDVYVYDLVENSSDANGPLIVDVGGDRVATRRILVNRRGGSCDNPPRLDAYTRHRLIAYWLGVKRDDMAWQPVEPVTIRWTNKADYEQQVGKIVESQGQKLRATVDGLRQRGVLAGPSAPPKLVVTIGRPREKFENRLLGPTNQNQVLLSRTCHHTHSTLLNPGSIRSWCNRCFRQSSALPRGEVRAGAMELCQRWIRIPLQKL